MILGIIPIAEASAQSLMNSINKVILNPLIIFLFALATVYFLYGVLQYLLSPNNEEVRKSSNSRILWGIIGMVVMFSVFGIMKIITNTLGVPEVIK